MILRNQIAQLIELGDFIPVIGILGPRQVGKTTLVKEYAKRLDKEWVYIDLEKPSDFQRMLDPELYFSSNQDKCIIVDEVQLKPELFPVIRAFVDERRVPLRFIILGSATPHLLRQSSESLAGRVAYIELFPFSLSELPEIEIQQHHFFGGFPNSILAKKDRQSSLWLDGFIKTYVERDLPLLGMSASPQVTRRLWQMLAWQSGGLLNASSIGKSLGLTNHTINNYIDFLEGAFMVNRLPSFATNVKKRIVKAPKIYISDTGLMHKLIGINSYEELFGSPLMGASWETYVVQQIKAELPESLETYYYRTHAGTEVDLVLTKGFKPHSCIEIKFSSAPTVTKGFQIGIDDLETKQNFIITPQGEAYQLKKNVTVISLRTFLKEILPNL
ncbi:MAG: ATP-binding protein [Cyclobacteriaceae bacterium]